MTAPPGQLHAFRVELAEILDCDKSELPRAFRGDKPLVLDLASVEHHLRIRYPGVDRYRLQGFLLRYTRSRHYLRRVVHSNSLHDIDGNSLRPIPWSIRNKASRQLKRYRVYPPEARNKPLATESVATKPLCRIECRTCANHHQDDSEKCCSG